MRVEPEDRVEVVEVPRRLEDVDLVGAAPDVEHVLPVRVLRGGLDPEAHAANLGPSTERENRLEERDVGLR